MVDLNKEKVDRFIMQRSKDQNYICYTDLCEADMNNVFQSFSIKYVYKGVEYYRLNSGEYPVRSNEIFYACSQPGRVYFDNIDKSHSIGLCIGLDQQLFLDALNLSCFGIVKNDFEQPERNYSDFPQFLEGIYHRQSKISDLLFNVCKNVESNIETFKQLDEEWYYWFASEIIKQEFHHYTAFSNLSSVKASTRKELYKRLRFAKEYMDDCYLQNPSISEIAKHALLSNYYFYHSFRLAYCISPYQYLLDKRLQFAKELMISGQLPVKKVAMLINFPDEFSFSKAFKRKFKITPSKLKKYDGYSK